MEKVCITGAGGRLGTLLTDALAGRYELTGLRRQAGAGEPVVDVRDAASLRGAFDGHDAVVHLAARVWADDNVSTLVATNLQGTLNVLNECVRAGVKRFVFASTLAVLAGYRQEIGALVAGGPLDLPTRERFVESLPLLLPEDDYALTKAYGEALCHLYAAAHGMGCVCLRIGEVHDEALPANAGPVDRLRWCRSDAFVAVVEQALERSRQPGFARLPVISD